jgi:peptide deformylase
VLGLSGRTPQGLTRAVQNEGRQPGNFHPKGPAPQRVYTDATLPVSGDTKPKSGVQHAIVMAILKILEFPDPCLRAVASAVTVFDQTLADLVQNMADTMYDAPGVGLAANQVGSTHRVVVIDISENHDHLQVFVNPEIVSASSEEVICEEGCLSFPGIYDKVKRPAQVKVRAQDLTGTHFELDCDDLMAVCVQHEIDHLNGTVFVDHLSLLKQARSLAKLRKRRQRM